MFSLLPIPPRPTLTTRRALSRSTLLLWRAWALVRVIATAGAPPLHGVRFAMRDASGWPPPSNVPLLMVSTAYGVAMRLSPIANHRKAICFAALTVLYADGAGIIWAPRRFAMTQVCRQ
ncbi:hypothetical protein ACNKHL_00285 [Shigella flexneri]